MPCHADRVRRNYTDIEAQPTALEPYHAQLATVVRITKKEIASWPDPISLANMIRDRVWR
jgi:hypothetical protein